MCPSVFRFDYSSIVLLPDGSGKVYLTTKDIRLPEGKKLKWGKFFAGENYSLIIDKGKGTGTLNFPMTYERSNNLSIIIWVILLFIDFVVCCFIAVMVHDKCEEKFGS